MINYLIKVFYVLSDILGFFMLGTHNKHHILTLLLMMREKKLLLILLISTDYGIQLSFKKYNILKIPTNILFNTY